ncbi:MAG TPA: hypothetical protein VIV84_09425, partial [Burkholderiaceae bacterium]
MVRSVALASRLKPDYIVIIGSSDLVPQFRVVNPSFDPEGDYDTRVLTDNPKTARNAPPPANRLRGRGRGLTCSARNCATPR